MASDNGDLEIQEDSLDARIKNHVRLGPAEELLNRCLSTIPPTNRIIEPQPVAGGPMSQEPNRAKFSPMVRWVLAASILIAVSGGYFFYNYFSRGNASVRFTLASRMSVAGSPEEMEKAVQRQEMVDASADRSVRSQHAGGGQFLPGNDPRAAGPSSSSTRIKDVRDGTSNTFGMGEVASTEESRPGDVEYVAGNRSSKAFDQSESARTRKEKEVLESLSSVDKSAIPFGDDTPASIKYRDPKKWEELTVGRTGEKREVSQATPSEAESKERRLGRGVHVSGRGLPQNLAELEQASELKTPFRMGGFNYERSSDRREITGLEGRGPNAEAYAGIVDNPFLPVTKCPLSTFSTDVDTASYANVRRFLSQGQMPPRDAVRIEELINYFSYDYTQAKAGDPFSVNLEVAGCPWNGEHRLVRIGLKGREIADQQRPSANLVFLVDVSGSMQPANKLPLLKAAMKMLVGRLGENERVAIVTYAQEIRLVLPSTTCDSKETIYQALDSLQAAGGTNGGGGIQMAYSVAVENFIQGGVNRVMLATDGDFNIGITDPNELTRLIEEKAKSGVFLSVLGFGYGNLKDATLERLADKGNGHFAYIDTIDEARKVLVDQLSGTLVTIAKDVKLQIEFNPRTVSAYRLIGYENRVMPAQDFNDDRKDAGDIGAGHTVTALYEIVPAGKSAGQPGTDPLKYQPEEKPAEELRPALDDGLRGDVRRELLTVKLRYKKPNEQQSLLAEIPLTDSGRRYGDASSDFKFASTVAAFGMILRDSPHRGSATFDGVLELGEDGRGPDREGYRSEFLKLVRQAKSLRGQ